jgi:fermentation-respiration switch protein FrsA (DUF1100 family)
LWGLVLDGQSVGKESVGRLSTESELILELCGCTSSERVDEILAALNPATLARLDEISPDTGIQQLRSRLYVLHSRADDVIPFTHSRRLAQEAPPAMLRDFLESDLIDHVTPNAGSGALSIVREMPGLTRHAWLLALELL